MKNWQASCDDGWKSKTVSAMTVDEAADMVAGELAAHLKETHTMDLPADPMEMHKSVVEHVKEVTEPMMPPTTPPTTPQM